MKTYLLFGSLALVLCACKPSGSPRENAVAQGPSLQVHFVGTKTFFAQGDHGKWGEIRTLPETAALIASVSQKLSRAPQIFLSKQRGQPVADASALVQPLILEALQRESVVEVHGTAEKKEIVVALSLDEPRANFWKTNLMTAFAAWKFGTPTNSAIGDVPVWENHSAVPAVTFKLAHAGQWLVLGLGSKEGEAFKNFVGSVKAGKVGIPLETNWFVARGDLNRLKEIPWFAEAARPRFEWSMRDRAKGNESTVVSEVLFKAPGDLDWKPANWNIPIETIDEPLTSFSAVRGIRDWLEDQKSFKALKFSETPDQAAAWSQGGLPFLTFASFPYNEGSQGLKASTPRIAEAVKENFPWASYGKVTWATNRVDDPAADPKNTNSVASLSREEVNWFGLPMILPFARVINEKAGSFLVGGFFPYTEGTGSVPAELLQQLNKSNLVYYGWEITGERVSHWRQLRNILNVLVDDHDLGPTAPETKWMMALEKRLGNSGTELTYINKRELRLIRNSHLGFTGIELVALMDWLSFPVFPLPSSYAPLREVTGEPPALPAPGPRKAPVVPATNKPAAKQPAPKN